MFRLNRIPRFGRRSRTCGSVGMEKIINGLCRADIHPRNGAQLIDFGCRNSVYCDEFFVQNALALVANALNFIQSRIKRIFCTHAAVIGNRKSVRLIPDTLQNLQCGAAPRKNDGLLPVGQNYFLIFSARPIAGIYDSPYSSKTSSATLSCPLPPSTTNRSGSSANFSSPASVRSNRLERCSRIAR